uniref:Armadillo repeat-containing protein 8 n=1 Tax=Chrysemys picta bellii TaxID=8478 RepID=A0A8C3FK64_CHRPI
MACVLETPLRMSVLSEVTASSRHYVDRLFDPDPQKVLQGVIDMKNAVIGNNKQKANLIVLGAVPRLLYLLQQETSSTELRTECAVVLGSLAMGTENNVKSLLDCHIIPALLQGLLSPELKFIEACLRCLRTIFTSPVTPEELLYTDATVIPHLMALLSRSRYTQEYICQIFSHCCKGPDHQTILFNHGAVQNIAHLLSSTSYKVRTGGGGPENPATGGADSQPEEVSDWMAGDHILGVHYRGRTSEAPCRESTSPGHLPDPHYETPSSTVPGTRRVLSTIHPPVCIHSSSLNQAVDKEQPPAGAGPIQPRLPPRVHPADRCLRGRVLQNAPDEVLVVASSTLCNLLLEFSPSKEPILESGAIELLCSLTQSENLALRVNGIWALMNMAFQAEQKIKADILQGLSTEQLFQLLSDSDVNVLMKTLGLLRNLLSTRPHIDQIMSTHGKQIMQAVTLILEGEHNIEVKEQTLCILANIADGTTAKELIMTNDDILQKIKYYMSHSNAKLQLAAMFCISNLIWNEEEGSQERQDKLRDIGIVDILHKLSQSSDPNLCDKAKTALQQYLA